MPGASIGCWSGDWMLCLFDPVISLVGEGAFGLLIGGMVFLVLFIVGRGDMAPPTVGLFLVSGILIPLLPGGMVGVAYTVAVIGVAAGIMAVIQKYVL